MEVIYEDKQKNQNNFFAKSLILLAWFSLLFTVIIVGLIGAITNGDPTITVKTWGISDFGIFAVAIHALGMSIAVIFLYYRLKKKGQSFALIAPFKKIDSKMFWIAIFFAFVAFVLYPFVDFVCKKIGLTMYWGETKESHLVINSSLDFFLILAGAVILSPITEEIIYRGFVISYFSQRYSNKAKIVLLSNLIFTSVHIAFGLGIMLYIFLWSFIPIYLFLRFKNIFPSLVFHFVNNLIAYIVLPLFGI